MSGLIPPLLEALNDSLDSVLVVGIGAVDDDIVLLDRVSKQVGVLQVADQGLDGRPARSRD